MCARPPRSQSREQRSPGVSCGRTGGLGRQTRSAGPTASAASASLRGCSERPGETSSTAQLLPLRRPWEGACGPRESGKSRSTSCGGPGGGHRSREASGPAQSARPWMRSRSDAPARLAPPSCLGKLPPIWEAFGAFFLLQPQRRPLIKSHDLGRPRRVEAADHAARQPPLKSAKPSLA